MSQKSDDALECLEPPMRVKQVQTVAMTASGAIILLLFFAESQIAKFNFVGNAILIGAYICAVTAVAATFVRYRREHRASLPSWRRIPYALALAMLALLCFTPFVTWHLVSSGNYPSWPNSRHEPISSCLFWANVAAIVLIWFGSGRSRIGLALVALLLFLLWALPIAIAT